MSTHIEATRVALARREIVALTDKQGFAVDCISGELWITAEGMAGDLILRTGERLQLSGRPRIVISALTPSVLEATPCCGTSPVRQLAAGCAAVLADRIKRWRHVPLAAYPVRQLR
ncbi:MAG: DUF2917 domain-containing protein [Betaproteobacteria bacterium]|nr:DUF2917 domain-containing protein [Betaproteobacteria bacterium]